MPKISVKFRRGHPNEVPNRGGIGSGRRFSTNISLYLKNGAIFFQWLPQLYHLSYLRSGWMTSCMTANLHTLNSSKIEFLLVGLKNQLAKIHNSSLLIDTSHSARDFAFIFDKHTFSDQVPSLSKACYYRQLRCIRPYLDSSTACTVPLSFTPNLITVILCIL